MYVPFPSFLSNADMRNQQEHENDETHEFKEQG